MEENIAVQNSEAVASGNEARPGQDFDALLRERDFQSEFDRRVSRALATARGKWAQETERRIESVRAEAEARMRMTGEERMAHDFAERQRQLEQREMELTRRELRAEAMRMIQERGLPAELAGIVNYSSAEGMQESLDAAQQAFTRAVQAGVEMRMRGDLPSAPQREDNRPQSDADYYRARYVPGKRPE